MKPMEPMKPLHTTRWWPESLGDSPGSAGGQNEMRYAYFADKRRLVVDEGGGKVSTFDTGGHEISGVQQDQSGEGRGLVFTGGGKPLSLRDLKRVSE